MNFSGGVLQKLSYRIHVSIFFSNIINFSGKTAEVGVTPTIRMTEKKNQSNWDEKHLVT